MSKPTVSVVVPNWNGKELLDTVLLPSLRKQTTQDFETIVVDNGSTDGSVEYLKGKSDIRTVLLRKNTGFAPAVNRGIEASQGEFVALVNNDVELAPDWLERMLAAAQRYPEAGSISSKLLDFHKRSTIGEVGHLASWHGTFTPIGAGQKDTGQYPAGMEVFSASGGAALYAMRALRDVGTFDESFFAYMEDVDWGFRARLKGYVCRFEPAAAYHIGGATTDRRSNFSLRLATRNTVLLILKDYPLSRLLKHFRRIAFGQFKTFYAAIKERWLWTYLRAMGGALIRVPGALGRRWRIQKGRTVNLRKLDTAITADFPLPSKILRRP